MTDTTEEQTSLRVCFVALHALPAIDVSLNRPVGGTETRAWTFAKGLATSGSVDVRFIVRTDSPRQPFRQDGVDVIPMEDRIYSLYESVGKCIERSSRFPGVRLRRWENKLVWQVPVLATYRILAGRSRDPWRADPFYTEQPVDVFCTFGVQANSARVIAAAHDSHRKAVLVIGSDGDLDERYTPGSSYVSPYGDVGSVCHAIIQRADAIVAQTEKQQQLLQDRFCRESTLVANPIDFDSWDAGRRSTLPDGTTCDLDRYVLWVGRAESVHKRPLLLLEVARLCPEVNFLMVLNPRDRTVEERVRRDAPANVKIVSQIPFDLMPAVFDHATVFVSTSSLEGFPNVFLQAAATGVPIVSLEVGDEFLKTSKSGFCTHGDLPRMAEHVRCLWTDLVTSTQRPRGGRDYVSAEHGLQTQTARLEAVLKSTAGAGDGDA
ncbi:MAG: glycosyltransferase family 4 protein [Planctomycetaceae bacterium]|nr:glycosyltransferase family 4 protein [Planctomycetaceae bacterium]